MKRLVTASVVLAAAFMMPARRVEPALAGCCKERSSYNDGWRKNGVSYEACERLNRERDGDNVNDARGLVWWDVRCD